MTSAKRQKLEDTPEGKTVKDPVQPIKVEPEEAELPVKIDPVKNEVVKEEYNSDDDYVDEDEDIKKIVLTTKEEREWKSKHCPYLDTIQRAILDFDFEKLCSISLSNLNVYACLVCGKYFQGRGKNTHCYTHSVHEDHHVFLNLHTLRAYCLPDNYEIIDATLEDIKYVLKPTFTQEEIISLRQTHKICRALDGTSYYQGIQGLNNIKANDYMNVILISLCHVTPIREFFLNEANYCNIKLPPGSIMFPLVQVGFN